jgi:cyclopropane-fatty-acyl-phospholipid synthase
VWWEVDLGYYLLKGLEWLKVVWDVQVPIDIASCGDLTTSKGTRALALKTTGTGSEASGAGSTGSKDGQGNAGLLVRTVRTRFERVLASAGILLDGPNPWDPQIHDPRFFLLVLAQGSLGVGRAYMDGLWDCEQLDELVARVLRTAPIEAKLDWQNRLLRLRARGANLQTVVRARKAIETHYDLDPEIFIAMLGPTMAYSCGYFQNTDSLDMAQLTKMDLICRKLGVRPGHRLLDIGCGWGSFVRYAAEHYGCEAIGVTISRAQHDFAAAQHSVHGARVLLLDYRDPALHKLGPFDRIVSVGMFEHVGRKNYAEFFRVTESLLTEAGLFLLHTIGNDHAPTDAWLNRYIFPNGMLPSTADIAQARRGRFIIEDWHNFRADYGRTIMAWYDNFERLYVPRHPEMPRRFHRMWRYYLLSMAGAFRAGNRNQLWQIVLSRRGLRCGYHSVR